MSEPIPGSPTGIPGIFEPFDDEEDDAIVKLAQALLVVAVPVVIVGLSFSAQWLQNEHATEFFFGLH